MRYLFWLLFLVGCHRDYYIDNDCEDWEVEIMHEGFAIFNEAFPDDDYRIVGRADLPEEYVEGYTIECINDRHKVPGGYRIGASANGNIWMYTWWYNPDRPDKYLSSFLHELGHTRGMEDTDDPNDIMYGWAQDPPIVEY